MPHETRYYKLENLSRKIVSRIADTVIVHCDYAKDLIRDMWKVKEDKIKVISHGSYIGYYPNTIPRDEARKKMGLEDDCFTFLFFGMLRNYKGVEKLIDSFREVETMASKVHLVIAGKPFNKTIKEEVEDAAAGCRNITYFLRFIKNDEVQIFLNAADVVVLPYLDILTSGTAILALSFGKGIIAPKKGCLPELVTDGVGLLYDTDRELREAMLNAIKLNGADRFDNKAHKIAEALNWDRLVKKEYLPLLTIIL